MPDRHEAPEQRTPASPAMRLFLGILAFFVASVALAVAFAAGLPFRGFLHWTGELLLIIGISLAAWGISDVRREWTQRPGVWRSIQTKAQPIASVLWVRWNRALERWPVLAKRLHLRIHLTDKRSGSVIVFAQTASAAAVALPGRVVVSGNLTVDERLDQLESRIKEADQQVRALRGLHEQHVREMSAVTGQEKAERSAEDQRLRDSIANLAGGGLKIQAWGVACLLAGTIMTAIW
jgi:hypothetical protein